MPKFGNHSPADIWAASTRTLTDLSAEEIFDLPEIDSTYPPVSCASSATANTFGSWVEVSADVGAGKRLLGVMIMPLIAGVGVGPLTELEFGEGGSGSEAAITRTELATFMLSLTGPINGFYVPLWRSLSDNARLSVRAKDDKATAYDYYLGAMIA